MIHLRSSWLAITLLCVSSALPTSAAFAANVQLTEVDRALPRFTLADHAGAAAGTDTATDTDTVANIDTATASKGEYTGADQTWTPQRLAGRYWVINFWATWCPPCVEEIPAMNVAREALKPAGVGMLAINAGEGGEAVDAFLEQIDVAFPIALGEPMTLSNWSVRGLPTTLIVNDSGRIIFEAIGPRDWDDPELLERLRALAQ